jgi:hypothetical protein
MVIFSFHRSVGPTRLSSLPSVRFSSPSFLPREAVRQRHFSAAGIAMHLVEAVSEDATAQEALRFPGHELREAATS